MHQSGNDGDDLVGGHVPVAIDAFDSMIGQHEAGKIKILASAGEKRVVSGIPTLKESGINLTAIGWNTFFAKNNMPTERVERYAKEISEAMKSKALREKFLSARILDPTSVGLADTRKNMAAFKKQWVPVIRNAGLKFD